MKTFKKTLAAFLAVLMIFSSCVIFSFAADENSAYVENFDTETPVIIVHGMSQNNTYLLDENGEWATNDDGKYITGWPLHIEIPALLETALAPLIKSIFLRKDAGLSDALYQAAYDALYVIQKDNEGNYIHDVEVPCYECPMSELSEEVKAEYYGFLPIQELSQIVGEDMVYYFGYDSIGDVIYETEKLHHYIHDVVLPQTGASQVKLCHISLGGTIAVNYLENYPEDYELIKKIVFVVPAIDGSNIIGDLLINNLSVYDDSVLYENLLVSLLGETPLAYILNMALRILPSDVLKSALEGLAGGVVNVAARTSTMLWALCPTEYYEEAKAIWLEGDEYALVRSKVDSFMKARANFEENLFELRDSGAELFDVACYDVPLFPLCKDYQKTNADRVIHAASPSMGATFADLGTTLGEDYVAAGTYCSDPTHNHLSPDGIVDATTGLLPCTTWYFKGQAHELLPHNDVALELAIHAMTDSNIKDVYSNPAYPQFNNGRITRDTNAMIKAWNEADQSKVSAKDKAEIEAAIADVKALEEETIVDIEAWTAAEDALEDALSGAGIVESSKPSQLDKVFTSFAKVANRAVNSVFNILDLEK
ncbi:MAG: hypothetical protein IJ262_09955 [Clostridia bacterium]|nr:hypothetical protein [Clostridia bacterium]